MADKNKSAARHIMRETGLSYMTALNIVRGDLRPIPQTPGCQIKLAFETMPEKIRIRLPELGQPAEGKPAPKRCVCARCDP